MHEQRKDALSGRRFKNSTPKFEHKQHLKAKRESKFSDQAEELSCEA